MGPSQQVASLAIHPDLQLVPVQIRPQAGLGSPKDSGPRTPYALEDGPVPAKVTAGWSTEGAAPEKGYQRMRRKDGEREEGRKEGAQALGTRLRRL